MGKDSLIKSTAKQKDADQEKEEAQKTKTAKPASPKKKAKAKAKKTAPKKATKKAAAKKKAPKKKAATPKAKSAAKPKPVKKAAKKKAAAKPKPAAKVAPPKKKPSIKELLMKKFDSASAPKTPRPAPVAQPTDQHVAPPFFSGRSDDETKRLKALLLKKFDLDELPAEPAPQPPKTEPSPPEPVVTEPETPPEVKAEETPAAPAPGVEMPPPVVEEPADPAEKMLKYLAGAFAFLVILVVGASFVNQGRFYLNASNGAVEIWQGKFAPKGQKLLIALPGAEMPEMASAVYTKQDVYPIIFNYYIDKADAILDVPGAPNFDDVKVYLDQALAYAVTPELRDVANARINNIDLLILMYKADVAGSRGTIESLEAALDFLADAKHLATGLQAQQIDLKMDAFSAALASLKAAQAEAEQLEADRQQLEQAEGAQQQ